MPNPVLTYIIDIYVKTEFGIKYPKMVDMPQNQTKPNQIWPR